MFTQEYFKLGYELQKNAGLFDSEEAIAQKRKIEIQDYVNRMNKGKREKDINHDYRVEKVIGAMGLGGALGIGAAHLAGGDPSILNRIALGGTLGLGTGYGVSKLLAYLYNNHVSDATKDKIRDSGVRSLKATPGWLI